MYCFEIHWFWYSGNRFVSLQNGSSGGIVPPRLAPPAGVFSCRLAVSLLHLLSHQYPATGTAVQNQLPQNG